MLVWNWVLGPVPSINPVRRRNPHFSRGMHPSIEVMHKIVVSVLHGLFSSFRTRMELRLEVAALRHQVEVLRRDQRSRVRLTRLDRALWVLLYRLWSRCLDAVVIVKPEAVVRWHRLGFRAFWSWNSRP